MNAYKPSNYEWLKENKEMVFPPKIGIRNEYQNNLLNLRGSSIIDETIIDHIDILLNEARADIGYVMHEQELNKISY